MSKLKQKELIRLFETLLELKESLRLNDNTGLTKKQMNEVTGAYRALRRQKLSSNYLLLPLSIDKLIKEFKLLMLFVH